MAHMPLDALRNRLRTGSPGPRAIVGTPDEVVGQIRAYAAAGVEEIMVHWSTLDDIEGLKLLAEHVMPHLSA